METYINLHPNPTRFYTLVSCECGGDLWRRLMLESESRAILRCEGCGREVFQPSPRTIPPAIIR